MSNSGSDKEIFYEVLMNEEGQYSLWMKGREIPSGWVTVGKQGRKEECLSFIDEVWVDMRPLSLRIKMDS